MRFFSHFLDWEFVGYFNMDTMWLPEVGIDSDVIWVDFDIIPTLGRTLGGHIVKLGEDMAILVNPNILMDLSNNYFNQKYPLSTLKLLCVHIYCKVPFET